LLPPERGVISSPAAAAGVGAAAAAGAAGAGEVVDYSVFGVTPFSVDYASGTSSGAFSSSGSGSGSGSDEATRLSVSTAHCGTPGQASAAYRQWFWADIRGDDLPPGLDLVLFDYAVNSGPGRPIRALQGLLGVEADGVFGPRTLAGMLALPRPCIGAVMAISAERLAFMRRAVDRRTDELLWPSFGRGWQARVERIQRAALAMA
jgi:hypothetical protein